MALPKNSKSSVKVKHFLRGMGDDMRLLLFGSEASHENESELLPQSKPSDKNGSLENERQNQENEIFEAVSEEELKAQQEKEAEEKQISLWRSELDKSLEKQKSAADAASQFFEQNHSQFLSLLRSTQNANSLEDELNQEMAEENDSSELEQISSTTSVEDVIIQNLPELDYSDYQLPTIELMDKMDHQSTVLVEPEELEKQKNLLQDTLDSFGIDAIVYDVIVGPRVRQYRIQPGIGVRVEEIAGLDKNLALALSAQSVRIQAPIPGEPFVGIEVPNQKSIPLTLRAMMESSSWKNTDCVLPLVLGMDLTGKIIITDLTKAPHLLIAGATGSGKSVCMSNIIMSLLYHFRPDELELLLIDPKRVEFTLYGNIPHLIHPVVTEPKKVIQVLKWIVKEMENRYQMLSEKQVRNIFGYNEKAEKEGFDKLPFIVVIIDELADLMMTSKGEVETSLARLAQLSRAAGIHTIIATQRPSVNVVTGVIKANFPTRIAFRVSSQIDSRTILDCKGAESLMGQGDMLFDPPGIARLLRLQAPWVSDEEINRVVNYLSEQKPPNFKLEFAETDDDNTSEGGLDLSSDDPMFKEALELVARHQRPTTSFIQRRLKIGYNRAANLIEQMEDRGYIGPQVGTNMREIFIGPEDV